MNTIDFIRETAAFMVKDRPDIYAMPTAVEEISTVIDLLREDPRDCSIVSFTSYVLIRTIDDGFEEFIFSKKMSGLTFDEEDETVTAFRYHDAVNLPSFEDYLDDDDEL